MPARGEATVKTTMETMVKTTKHIWIMRHGDAPYSNGERQISEHGHEQIAQTALWFEKQLSNKGLTLDTLLVSPVLRAQQTADTFEKILLKQTGQASSDKNRPWLRQTESLLSPESSSEITVPFVEETTSGTSLLISHMPLVSNLWAAWLAGESNYFPTASIGGIELCSDGDVRKVQEITFHSPNID